MHSIVHAADIQDRDSGNAGPKVQQALKLVCGQINVEIVKRTDAGRFVVLPSAGWWSEPHWLAQPMPAAGKD